MEAKTSRWIGRPIWAGTQSPADRECWWVSVSSDTKLATQLWPIPICSDKQRRKILQTTTGPTDVQTPLAKYKGYWPVNYFPLRFQNVRFDGLIGTAYLRKLLRRLGN